MIWKKLKNQTTEIVKSKEKRDSLLLKIRKWLQPYYVPKPPNIKKKAKVSKKENTPLELTDVQKVEQGILLIPMYDAKEPLDDILNVDKKKPDLNTMWYWHDNKR